MVWEAVSVSKWLASFVQVDLTGQCGDELAAVMVRCSFLNVGVAVPSFVPIWWIAWSLFLGVIVGWSLESLRALTRLGRRILHEARRIQEQEEPEEAHPPAAPRRGRASRAVKPRGIH